MPCWRRRASPGASQLLTGRAADARPAGPQVPTRVVAFERRGLQALLAAEPVLMRRVARLMRPVFERAAGAVGLQERLAAPGRLAAGLAHELNNPAAAARRSARELEEVSRPCRTPCTPSSRAAWSASEAAELVELQREAMAGAGRAPPPLDA